MGGGGAEEREGNKGDRAQGPHKGEGRDWGATLSPPPSALGLALQVAMGKTLCSVYLPGPADAPPKKSRVARHATHTPPRSAQVC